MIKQSNLVKSSFTLLETLLSITILTFIISGFVNFTYYDEQNNKNFMFLNNLENLFGTNAYKTLNKYSKTLQIKINDRDDFINIDFYEYKDENIRLIKYEK